MEAEGLDSGKQAPPPACGQTEELPEQMAAVKKLREKVHHQKSILRQHEQINKDMSTQLHELHNKYLLVSEVNKRLFVKSKRLEGAYEELCHENRAAKEEMKEQRSLILDLQQRLGELEATKKQDKLLASENAKEKEALKREVAGLCLQVKMAKDEMKEQKSLMRHLQQRLDRLEATRQRMDAELAVSQPQEEQRKSSAKEEEGEKGKPAAAADAKVGSKEPPAGGPEPRNKTTNCKDKAAAAAAACGRTGATAKVVSGDNCPAKPRNATAPKGQSDPPGTEKKAAAERKKPRISLDFRPNLKEAKPVRAPPPSEKRESKVPPTAKDRTAPFHRTLPKENLLPGRLGANRSGPSVPNAAQGARKTSLAAAAQILHDPAKNRIPKVPPLRTNPLLPHQNSQKFPGAKAPPTVVPAAPEWRQERSLFPPTNVVFQKDKDFSPWEHRSWTDSSDEGGEDNK